MELISRKTKRILSGGLFAILLLIGLNASVTANAEDPINCYKPDGTELTELESGKKGAIFVLTDIEIPHLGCGTAGWKYKEDHPIGNGKSYDSLNKSFPGALIKFCVIVDSGAVSVSYFDLLKAMDVAFGKIGGVNPMPNETIANDPNYKFIRKQREQCLPKDVIKFSNENYPHLSQECPLLSNGFLTTAYEELDRSAVGYNFELKYKGASTCEVEEKTVSDAFGTETKVDGEIYSPRIRYEVEEKENYYKTPRYIYFERFWGEPIEDQKSIEWPKDPDFKVIAGETISDVTIVAVPKTEAGPAKITCVDCAEKSAAVVSSSDNKINITFDSGAYFEKQENINSVGSLPMDLFFTLRGTLPSFKYSDYKFPIKIQPFNCGKYENSNDCSKNKLCFFFNDKCESRHDGSLCKDLNTPVLCGLSRVCTWNEQSQKCLEPVGAYIAKGHGKPAGYKGPMPDCAFQGNCDDVNEILKMVIAWGQMIFKLIGSIAFVMFIYGGFTMVFSAGNPEKVKKGTGMLVAAVIGLIIAFSAYILVNFILDALNVTTYYRGVKD